ncbi:MAG: Glycerol-3-phosphate cytidylyltransferase [Parcubacteria group bacterium GW2011_GWF2_43_11]|nr:MAG: Glycerol-3-phosphate cytidylyltransferase [Parcubacteria group bacterium GW2011_GWF2_43_11]
MQKTNKKRKPIIVAVSGGMDPLHIGHVRLFQGAKKLGDKLIVIINNDNWLLAKKGYVFMPQKERKEVLEALGCVDEVVLTKHPKNPKDMSVAKELLEIKPDIFARGGDRKPGNVPLPSSEIKTCQAIGCKIVYNVGKGGKIQSSSWLVEKIKNMPE